MDQKLLQFIAESPNLIFLNAKQFFQMSYCFSFVCVLISDVNHATVTLHCLILS